MPHIGPRPTRVLPPRPGLGQIPPTLPIPPPAPATVPSDPLYARLLAANLPPILGALSTRIAYGQTARPPTGGGYYYPGSGGGTFGFAGISQSTLLIGALVLGAVLIFKR